MPPIPKPTPSTVQAIYRAYEEAAESWDSLGISVGEANSACDRSIWYSFRWATPIETFSGKQLRLFDTGNREEERLVEDMRRIGVDVYGQQDRIRLVGGHVRGKCDGKGVGLPEAPKTEHLFEFKSSNAKNMRQIVKLGCEKAKPLHYGQCQLGMHAFGLSRCMYLVSCKNTDDIYAERIEYNLEFCLRLLARLERIVTDQNPPPRISEKPDWFECKLCKHQAVCHEGSMPRVSCRSCLHATPIVDGNAGWDCARWSKPVSFDEQKSACPAHLFIPSMVPGEQVDVDEDAETITYRLATGELWTDGATTA